MTSPEHKIFMTTPLALNRSETQSHTPQMEARRNTEVRGKNTWTTFKKQYHTRCEHAHRSWTNLCSGVVQAVGLLPSVPLSFTVSCTDSTSQKKGGPADSRDRTFSAQTALPKRSGIEEFDVPSQTARTRRPVKLREPHGWSFPRDTVSQSCGHLRIGRPLNLGNSLTQAAAAARISGPGSFGNSNAGDSHAIWDAVCVRENTERNAPTTTNNLLSEIVPRRPQRE